MILKYKIFLLVFFVLGISIACDSFFSSSSKISVKNSDGTSDESGDGAGFDAGETSSDPGGTPTQADPTLQSALAVLPTIADISSPLSSAHPIITSTFGPRLKASESDRYDFHRGIDLPGELNDPVYAVADGIIYRAYLEGNTAFPDGGTVIVIRHTLPASLEFHGFEVTQYYSLYLHLNQLGTKASEYVSSGTQETVKKGELIGYLGQTGTTTFNHLHFEIRLQTMCSLEYQLANPTLSCAGYGFDPHVNPVPLLYDDISGDYDMTLTDQGEGSFTVVTSELVARPDLDGLTVAVSDNNSFKNSVYAQIISFDERTSFDPTSTATLDTSDLGDVVITPSKFISSDTNHTIDFSWQLPSSVWSGSSHLYLKVVLNSSTQSEVTKTLLLK